jgi:glyoxylase-like metal-dependent hydrolase (beta-lactamase superfamily II)
MDEYYDPLAGFRYDRLKSPSSRLKFRAAPLLRDALTPVFGREGAYEKIMPLGLKKFESVNLSKATIQPFETLPRRELDLGGAVWTGWLLGENDVWVLEDRGHSPDHVFFYIPEHRFLYTGDSTYDIFTIWPDTSGAAIRVSLGKCAAMARAGGVDVLADAHHHRVYRGEGEISAFLERLLDGDRTFHEVLIDVVKRHPGLTVPQVYARLEGTRREPVVQKYLGLEFPHASGILQAILLMTLLELGCEAAGPRGRKRFYPPEADRPLQVGTTGGERSLKIQKGVTR